MPPLETSRLSIGDLLVSSKGGKSVPIYDCEQPLVWKPGPLSVTWQPKAFNDPSATRVSICFNSNPEVEAYLSALDAWVLKAVAAAPRKYFGVDLTPEQVVERYTSSIKTTQRGYSHLRAKMNLSGKNAVRCWDAQTKARRQIPEEWLACEVQPSIEIKGIWIMNKDFGLLLECTDALVSEYMAACPF